ncbi:MAG: OadG family transporter subunit [Dysgonamonadaceae bacterium]|nr:OadG family transporter subunit [Dysgonamonadaceae bacterium]MDD4728707.1 OadG family transporter subunit [Dysgonamonadaceae bacterium]
MTDKIKLSILAILLLLFAGCNEKFDRSDLVINEVVVENIDGYTNDFGERSAWIEIYNNTTRTLELSSIYITNDPNDTKKYAVPRGDVKTQLKPHQQAVFWADNKPSNGTFHLNFKLDPNKENYIALYESDGETLIDELLIPAELQANQSYGYEQDGIKNDKSGHLAKILSRVTPNSNNFVEGVNPKITALKENDPWGGVMTVTAMFVVFMALLLLFIAFKFTGKTAKWLTKQKAIESGNIISQDKDHELSGEILAAISAAIYEIDQDVHDIESTILTIDEVKRNYSPWSSKIYGLRQLPKK